MAANYNNYAQMGYVGSVQLDNQAGSNIVVRVTSADIKTSQEITYPEVIDGKIDTTLYQLGPKITGGNIAFPLVHEGAALPISLSANCTSTTSTLAAQIWAYAAQRNNIGRLSNTLLAHVRYTDNTAFDYPGCFINTMAFNFVKGESVNVTAEVFGGSGQATGIDSARSAYTGLLNPPFLSPARIVTWNDTLVEIYNDSGVSMLTGAGILEFTCSINNGLERVYTLNGQLSAFDIVAKKRELSGTVKVLGRSNALGPWAYQNEDRYTSKSAIAFGYTLGGNTATAYWANAFYGCIFQIEEMAMTTGVFETTHNWRALGDCDRDFLATSMGASGLSTANTDANGVKTTLPYPTATTPGTGNNYGAETGCDSTNSDDGNPSGGACFPSGFSLGNSGQ